MNETVESLALGMSMKALADRKELSCNAVARKLAVPASTVSRWFNGKRMPPMPELIRFMRACGVNPRDGVAECIDSILEAESCDEN